MKDKTKNNPLAPINYFFSRYNLMIFVIVIAVGLSMAILTLTSILQIPYNGSVSGTTESITFDEATIGQVNQLNVSSQNSVSPMGLYGKSNLFAE